MHCSGCGSANVYGAKYCSTCGKRLKTRPDPTFFKVFTLITVTVNCAVVVLTAALVCAVLFRLTGGGDTETPSPEDCSERSDTPITETEDISGEFAESTPVPDFKDAMAELSSDAAPLYALRDFMISGDSSLAKDIVLPGLLGELRLPFPIGDAETQILRTKIKEKLNELCGEFESLDIRVNARRELTKSERTELDKRLGDNVLEDCRIIDAELIVVSAGETKSFPISLTVVQIGGSWYIDPASIEK